MTLGGVPMEEEKLNNKTMLEVEPNLNWDVLTSILSRCLTVN